ncbi:MAG: hypothetical protein K6B15_08985 [Parasporobacterium sp.]|nr:hypothetical protein [Parasporobacterium sp.]
MSSVITVLFFLVWIVTLIWVIFLFAKGFLKGTTPSESKKKKILVATSIVSFILMLVVAPPNEEMNKQSKEEVAIEQEAKKLENEVKQEIKTEKQEVKISLPICPRAGIGDTKENFTRAVAGRFTSDMTYIGKDGVEAVFAGDKVHNLTVNCKATVNGRHSDASVKDYVPSDAALVEDKGEANDHPGSWRWWSVYHSDKLAESIPESNGNFVIIQRLYDTGTLVFTIGIGDHL